MIKKMMMLALAGAAMLAFPAVASAEDTPLHLNPTPAGAKAISGGVAELSATNGDTVTCNSVSGSATFESGGTTGHMNLTFTGDCRENTFMSTCTNETPNRESIMTTELAFHLVTLAGSKPGVLVTANAGHFATFECAGGLITTKIEGNGVVGTIQNECGSTSETMTIKFVGAKGVQEHTKVFGTETVYQMISGGNNVAENATGTVNMHEKIKLECT
jgi:hypothetical protein